MTDDVAQSDFDGQMWKIVQKIGPIATPEEFDQAIEGVREILDESIADGVYPYAMLNGQIGFHPIADNPNLTNDMVHREVKVTCSNLHQYVFFQEVVEQPEGFGLTGARFYGDEAVSCPECGEPVADAKSYAMHSAGNFNAVLHMGKSK